VDGELLDPTALARWETIAPLAVNDFEPVVAARHPAIASLVGTLRASGCTPALMSGSGSVVFGVVPPGIDPAVVRGDPTARTVRTRTAARVEPVEALD
jgi:4-diphosphocytidyl-2C-methyl-D-erythritol kinase